MPSFINLTTFLFFGQLIPAYVCYTWPNPTLDLAEDMYTVVGGLGQSGILGGVSPCSFEGANNFTSGRQAAAEWLRLAYHDMSTHDFSKGTGGLDASIQFELDRPQNVGAGMASSLNFFTNFQSSHMSMSDVIALGTIYAIKACNGPSIPFRAGRIDASKAGPATVPEPQQDLASHTASFARQGFNVSEMIGLVACGHTIGGVHQVDFPTIVRNRINSTNIEGMAHFDSTFDKFDNRIATEWVKNNSTNLLAVGSNKTMNSDARIFAADKNVTMKGFASNPTGFANRCGDLIGRMLDTVPKEVKLSEPITPLPVKPWGLALSLGADGKLHLEGFMRFFSTGAIDSANMKASITWTDRNRKASSKFTSTLKWPSLFSDSFSGSVNMMQVAVTLDPASSISSFVADWAPTATATTERANNGGKGFPIQDVIMLHKANSSSCFKGNKNIVKVAAAIRNDRPLTSAIVSYARENTVKNGSTYIQYTFANATFKRLGPSPSPLYTLYQANFELPGFTTSWLDLIAVVDGVSYTDRMKSTSELPSDC